MASTDDVISNIKGGVTNIAQLIKAFSSPGLYAQGTTSPVATIQTAVGSTSLQVVAFNGQRRAISFHNSNPSGTTIWVIPSAFTAVIAQGVPIVPGADFVIDASLGANCAWNAIAGGGTNVLTILEFV